jgi:hypothetical protein
MYKTLHVTRHQTHTTGESESQHPRYDVLSNGQLLAIPASVTLHIVFPNNVNKALDHLSRSVQLLRERFNVS